MRHKRCEAANKLRHVCLNGKLQNPWTKIAGKRQSKVVTGVKQTGRHYSCAHDQKQRDNPISMVWQCRSELRASSGQGTTEYAILVGVLVVIAILAITVFRPRLQELWDAISSGINSL